MRRVIYACVLRQIILNQERSLPSLEELQMMPFFHQEEDMAPDCLEEVDSLRHFLRAVQTLHAIGLSGHNNKMTYIAIAGMLDGSNRSYAFGGAPSKAMIRRSVIFHLVTDAPMRDAPKDRKRRRELKLLNDCTVSASPPPSLDQNDQDLQTTSLSDEELAEELIDLLASSEVPRHDDLTVQSPSHCAQDHFAFPADTADLATDASTHHCKKSRTEPPHQPSLGL
jgi:hypothetical protein